MTQIVNCYHCGLPAVNGDKYCTIILDHNRIMCCPGCQAVAQAIVENGLDDYYRFRTEPSVKADDNLQETLDQLAIFDEQSIQQDFVIHQGDVSEIQLSLSGISCAACGWLIEKQLSKVKGIKQVSVNVTANRALVSWYSDVVTLSQIMASIERIGYHPSPFQQEQHEALFQQSHKTQLKRIGLAGLMTMQVMMLAVGVYFDLFGDLERETSSFFSWVSLILSTPVVFYSGAGFYHSAYKALKGRTVNMDVPVSIALLATYFSGVWATVFEQGQVYFESVCMFIFLLLVSRFIEHQARHKAAQISANMLQYIPLTANLLIEEQLQPTLAKSLQLDDVILVKAGETVPIDGVVLSGSAQIDESLLTGEFYPVDKNPDDSVYGGTINKSGTLTIRVTSAFKYALVNQIARLQEQAMANKPKIATMADQFSQYFVMAVLFFSLGSFIFWWWQGNPEAFWIAISVLIATCPCALGLATPSALSFAMANLNKQGVLLKRSDVLEQLTQIDHVVLDKTGTLTQGKISIAAMNNISDLSDETLLRYAHSVEQFSEHPIARAFNNSLAFPDVTEFSFTLGEGVSGKVNQKWVELLGTHTLSSTTNAVPRALTGSSIVMRIGGQFVCGFTLSDTLRPDASDMLRRLSRKDISLLSGDNKTNVQQIADSLGISNWLAEQSPQDKLAFVQNLQSEQHSVLMIGDGINDAPVLAQADVAVTLGAGADLAKSSADIILLKNALGKLPNLFTIAHRCKQKIRQNMAWALGYNILVLPLAVSGVLTPWMAVIGMSLSSIIVVINSVRLLK
ncbi:heavy metal translocating P-type ATPase [Paraglaciecola polaris]|uniref:heavy metal translocating P-type ATPase n=2 Tax=Paraglaciecola polaris TaxID=222814 RepID=UPI0030EBF13B|tara:strand:+ start:53933 stop:56317 length:2385 start_codon:yes stop_codon:yes gene_type:complete